MNGSLVPKQNDVLMGRGYGTAKPNHYGNFQLRLLALSRAITYSSARKKIKTQISREIVCDVQRLSPPGRFLRCLPGTEDQWELASDADARDKTAQLLRDLVAKVTKRNVNRDVCIANMTKALMKKLRDPTDRITESPDQDDRNLAETLAHKESRLIAQAKRLNKLQQDLLVSTQKLCPLSNSHYYSATPNQIQNCRKVLTSHSLTDQAKRMNRLQQDLLVSTRLCPLSNSHYSSANARPTPDSSHKVDDSKFMLAGHHLSTDTPRQYPLDNDLSRQQAYSSFSIARAYQLAQQIDKIDRDNRYVLQGSLQDEHNSVTWPTKRPFSATNSELNGNGTGTPLDSFACPNLPPLPHLPSPKRTKFSSTNWNSRSDRYERYSRFLSDRIANAESNQMSMMQESYHSGLFH